MNEIYSFIKEAGVFYLATSYQGVPYVRPFGELLLLDGKLYFNTGNTKEVYRQLQMNANVALCVFHKGRTLRVMGTARENSDMNVRNAMLESQKGIAKMYEGKEHTFVIFELNVNCAYFDTFNKREIVVESAL